MTEPFDRLLKQTLDDYRLSRGEKRVLAQIIRELAVDEQGRALVRSRVFEVAREALAASAEPAARNAAGVLDWLEDVHKLLLPTADARTEADDRAESHMHHKFALFDRRTVLTGSYNWTRSAADENQENVVVSRDPQLARSFQQEFDRLWEQWK